MKGTKKQDLPEKTCLACQRPFTWRKKWEKIGKKLNIAVKDVEIIK
jgi:hypothetical protein